MEDNFIEIGDSLLFEEYLHSLGAPLPAGEREAEIYLRERHLGSVRQVRGKQRYFLNAAALTRA